MTWVITLTNDAWDDYNHLSPTDKAHFRSLVFDQWVNEGPSADRVRLTEGMIVRHKEFAPSRYVRFIVPSESNVLIIRLLAGIF